jgi:hypothetical protein
MAATAAAAADIAIEDRAHQLTWFPVPGAEYAFCRTCGGSLFWRAETSPEVLSICAGTLEPPTGLRTVRACSTPSSCQTSSGPPRVSSSRG